MLKISPEDYQLHPEDLSERDPADIFNLGVSWGLVRIMLEQGDPFSLQCRVDDQEFLCRQVETAGKSVAPHWLGNGLVKITIR